MVDTERLYKSFSYALEGIQFAFTHNQNLRIAFIGGAIVAVFSLLLDISPFEMGILGVMILLVICAEMMNSAIEEMVNFLINEHRREAKIAKDVSAGMVLITLAGSIIVGFLVFLPHIYSLFFGKHT